MSEIFFIEKKGRALQLLENTSDIQEFVHDAKGSAASSGMKLAASV